MTSTLHLLDDDTHRPLRRHHHGDFSVDELVAAKGGRTVSICIPARDEVDTVGAIVTALRNELQVRHDLADEILVIDDHSTDGTSAAAAAAGARVVDASDVLAEFGEGHGKGEVLWKSLYVSTGDIVVWCDADIRQFETRFVTGILGPLLCDDGVDFVKGHYHRPEHGEAGGGRVTELVARPLLSMFFPRLAEIIQPLSGEYGATREVLEQLPFVQGYGVDVGLLIDLERLVGTGRMAQVDLDVRHHRNRPLSELSPQAMAVAATILRRAQPGLVGAEATLIRPDSADLAVVLSERPALVELASLNRRPRPSDGSPATATNVRAAPPR